MVLNKIPPLSNQAPHFKNKKKIKVEITSYHITPNGEKGKGYRPCSGGANAPPESPPSTLRMETNLAKGGNCKSKRGKKTRGWAGYRYPLIAQNAFLELKKPRKWARIRSMTNTHSLQFITKRQNTLASLEQEAQNHFLFVFNAGMNTDANVFAWHLYNFSRVVGKMRRLRPYSNFWRN